MADIKISEMEELLPYDDYLATGGVDNNDFLTLLDISETDLSKLNKKIKFSTLTESLAPLNSPSFTGNPTVPTPQLTLNNSNLMPNITWVVEKLKTISLSSLLDVNSTLSPQDGQALIFNGLTNKWTTGSTTTTNREILANPKTLTTTDATYQFLEVNGTVQSVILPTGQANLRYVIKNIDPFNGTLEVKENTTTIALADTNSRIVECIHDGTEWHIINF